MTKVILILAIGFGGGVTMEQVPMNSMESCEVAGKRFEKEVKHGKYVCLLR